MSSTPSISKGLAASRWAPHAAPGEKNETASPDNGKKANKTGLAASRWAPCDPAPDAVNGNSRNTNGLEASRSAPPVAAPASPSLTPVSREKKKIPRYVSGWGDVILINEMPPGAKGLAASRWATPSQDDDGTSPAAATDDTAAVAPSPAPDSAERRGVPRYVSGWGDVILVNELPPGSKGLAASRWATPAQDDDSTTSPAAADTALVVLSRAPAAPSPSPGPVVPWQGYYIAPSPAPIGHSHAHPAPSHAQPSLSPTSATGEKLKQDTPVYVDVWVDNGGDRRIFEIPDGAEGLAASRWAN